MAKRDSRRKSSSRQKRDLGRFVDQSTGRKFDDITSTGEPIPKRYLLRNSYTQWLYDSSGRDRIINYSFGNIDGPFVAADGYYDIHRITSSPVTPSERDYITGQLSFMEQKLGLQFVETSYDDADLRFIAASSDNKNSDGFATIGYPKVDIVWERLGYSTINGLIRSSISHELGHALGLEHVNVLSGMSENEIHEKWGVSDSIMIAWEMPSDFYNTQFSPEHQWFSKNDLDALQLAWSSVI